MNPAESRESAPRDPFPKVLVNKSNSRFSAWRIASRLFPRKGKFGSRFTTKKAKCHESTCCDPAPPGTGTAVEVAGEGCFLVGSDEPGEGVVVRLKSHGEVFAYATVLVFGLVGRAVSQNWITSGEMR